MRRNSSSRGGRAISPRLAGLIGLIAALSALVIGLSASSSLAANSASQRVALIPGPGPTPSSNLDGIMPTSSYVMGEPSEQFSRFSFTDVALDQITPAKLASFDTVALIQVHSSSLSPAAKDALAKFVVNGGKLVIQDADETSGNDYTWLLGGASTKVGAACNNCGSQSGTSTVVTDSGIISSNPADSSYVNIPDMYKFTDQGDANLLVSTDPRWKTLVQGTRNGDSGAVVAYAQNGTGLIIYNGFDTDFIKSDPTERNRCAGLPTAAPYYCPANGPQPTVDWLAHMWYLELAQGWGPGAANLPAPPVVGIGTPISPGSAGLPPVPAGHACVARKRLRLSLSRFAHLRGRKIVQVDVYVNGKHRLRERRHFRNQTLRRLPGHGRYTVTVVATTKRGYHLIAKRRYRAC